MSFKNVNNTTEWTHFRVTVCTCFWSPCTYVVFVLKFDKSRVRSQSVTLRHSFGKDVYTPLRSAFEITTTIVVLHKCV